MVIINIKLCRAYYVMYRVDGPIVTTCDVIYSVSVHSVTNGYIV